MKHKWVRLTLVIAGVVLVLLIARGGLIAIKYRAIASGGSADWLIMQHPLYTGDRSMSFIVDHDGEIDLSLWWDGLTGRVDVAIVDEQGNAYFHEKANRIDRKYAVSLREGTYELTVGISHFTGAMAIGYDDITVVRNLPDDRYALIPADPEKGFQWDYLLYIPREVTHGNLLVVPNNTGYPSDNIDIHREEAKDLVIEDSGMANELGVPLLVPVFPRTKEMYTHALDRLTMMTDIEELKRLDLQLVAMIDDARGVLQEKGIEPEDQILMAGFSASGDFADRFTFLHPGIVKAASMGGAEILTLPCAALRGENLPYPLGVYDYEVITGEPFDMDAFTAVYRRLYKGSADEGGWNEVVENGEAITYTGREYYEKYELPQIMADLAERQIPIYTGGELGDTDIKQISYRVYDGKILLDQFLMVKSLFEEMHLDRNEFTVYEGVAHEVTDSMWDDEVAFFKRVLAEDE